MEEVLEGRAGKKKEHHEVVKVDHDEEHTGEDGQNVGEEEPGDHVVVGDQGEHAETDSHPASPSESTGEDL